MSDRSAIEWTDLEPRDRLHEGVAWLRLGLPLRDSPSSYPCGRLGGRLVLLG